MKPIKPHENCPEWLMPSEHGVDGTNYEFIKPKAKVVTRIYELALNGYSDEKILQFLQNNEKDLKPIGHRKQKGGGPLREWKIQNIAHMLNNWAVIGYATLEKESRLERVYPRLIPAHVFFDILWLREKKLGGRQSQNLFSCLWFCGQPIRAVNQDGGAEVRLCNRELKFRTTKNNPAASYIECPGTDHLKGPREYFNYLTIERVLLERIGNRVRVPMIGIPEWTEISDSKNERGRRERRYMITTALRLLVDRIYISYDVITIEYRGGDVSRFLTPAGAAGLAENELAEQSAGETTIEP